MIEGMLPCPECGSSDVSRHLIETKPHCNKCGFWAPESWGDQQAALQEWNRLSAEKWELKEIPSRVENLEKRVADLESSIHKMDEPDKPK